MKGKEGLVWTAQQLFEHFSIND